MHNRILRLWLCAMAFPLFASCGGNYEPVTKEAAKPPVAQSMPLPDCAPENCNGLRIIDGNAEAFRADSLRRALDPITP